MQSLSGFGTRFSLWERWRQRINRALSAYWRVSRAIYAAVIVGTVIPGLVGWLLQAITKTGRPSVPDFAHYAPLQAVLAVPWPITAVVAASIASSLIVAGRANRDRPYYELLKASAASFPRARLSYPAIAAQLRNQGDSQAVDSGQAVFDEELYTERAEALKIYADFASQRKKRILLIVGHGGSGKSTFLLQRMAELSGVRASNDISSRPHPCLFINCRMDHVTSYTGLAVLIKEKLGKGLDDILTDAVRGRRNRALVIFIDAINENLSSDEAGINRHLTNFAQQYLTGEHEIYLCVSVRKTYWDEQRRIHAKDPNSQELGWHNYVYLPDRGTVAVTGRSAEAASILLDTFSDLEFKEAYRRHGKVYGIAGDIPGQRTRDICANPLMLQMFSIAFRDRDVSRLDVVHSLERDLDIFDEYAKGALARAENYIGAQHADSMQGGETEAERAIRGLLLELALKMVETGSQFISDDEVYAVARDRAPAALTIAGQHVTTIGGLYGKKAVLTAILAEGIILERGTAVGADGEQVTGVRFGSERYLEYSIGRAQVRRWRLDKTTQAMIVEDFSRFMDKHTMLAKAGFNNLRQGLGIAILVAEQHTSGLPAGVHLDLIDLLVRHADFDWNQLACRVIQQLPPFNRAPSDRPEKHEQDVEVLLNVLDELAKKNDFVLRWDIEWALEQAVDAGEGQAVLRHLQSWMQPTATFAQRLFAGESLGFIFKQRQDQRRNVVGALTTIIDSANALESNDKLDFWILRSLTFSISTMIETLHHDPPSTPLPAQTDADLAQELQQLAEELLKFGHRWWDRSVALSSQIKRASPVELARWIALPWERESRWTRVNAALATEQACARGQCSREIVALLNRLRQAAPTYDPYLDWAVWNVLRQAMNAEATPKPVRSLATKLHVAIGNEARRRLVDDPRAMWVAQSDPLDDDGTQDVPATSVVLVYHPEYGHTDLHNHPESKERVQAILDFLDEFGHEAGHDLRGLLTYVSPLRFRQWDDDLLNVHPIEWIKRVQELSQQLAGGEKDIVLESDIEVRAGSYQGAVLAVRGAVCAVDVVMSAPLVRLAVALVRPPGHLAGNKICIFNNIAAAARYGQRVLATRAGRPVGRPRVLIVDCDAHHGKSTQDIFYTDDSVLYFSIHQAGVHPGTGRFDERGEGPGRGYTVNVPIPAHSGDRVYAEVLRRILEPILTSFRPELIMVSMGLDAHHHDNFSQLELSEWSYWKLASTLLAYQQDNPGVGVVATLEGGYDLESMGQCVLQFMNVLGNWDAAQPDRPTPRPPSTSGLDEYLLRNDAGEQLPPLSDNDRIWLTEFTDLEAELSHELADPAVAVKASA